MFLPIVFCNQIFRIVLDFLKFITNIIIVNVVTIYCCYLVLSSLLHYLLPPSPILPLAIKVGGDGDIVYYAQFTQILANKGCRHGALGRLSSLGINAELPCSVGGVCTVDPAVTGLALASLAQGRGEGGGGGCPPSPSLPPGC